MKEFRKLDKDGSGEVGEKPVDGRPERRCYCKRVEGYGYEHPCRKRQFGTEYVADSHSNQLHLVAMP